MPDAQPLADSLLNSNVYRPTWPHVAVIFGPIFAMQGVALALLGRSPSGLGISSWDVLIIVVKCVVFTGIAMMYRRTGAVRLVDATIVNGNRRRAMSLPDVSQVVQSHWLGMRRLRLVDTFGKTLDIWGRYENEPELFAAMRELVPAGHPLDAFIETHHLDTIPT